MRISITSWLAGIALCASMTVAAQTPAAPGGAPPSPAATKGAAGAGGVSKELVGSWKSTPLTWPLTGEFEASVWGKNAKSVRTVELAVEPSGDAVLTVTTRILDARGRAVRGPTSIETSRLKVGGPTESSAVGTDHAVTVVSAKRRYPDDPVSEWALDGLKVRLITREDSPALELRYDTPEGRGSFWETLSRPGRTPRSTTPQPPRGPTSQKPGGTAPQTSRGAPPATAGKAP